MGEIIGYLRVSTVEQNEARQTEALKEKGCTKLFMDKCSGKDRNRPEFNRMMEFLREGDLLIVKSCDRLGRSTRDLFNIIHELQEKGVDVNIIDGDIKTNTANGKLMLGIMSTLAEFERDIILERQREGIAIAKKEGKYKGKKQTPVPENFTEVYDIWKTRGINGKEAMRQLDLKPNTFYRMVKRHEEGL